MIKGEGEDGLPPPLNSKIKKDLETAKRNRNKKFRFSEYDYKSIS